MDRVKNLVGAPRYDTPSYLWPRPRYRGVLHAVGAAAIVPLGVWLVLASTPGRARLAATVYVVAQLCVFATSASYHRLARSDEARRRMQLADHAMIYVLIAGTWMPICLLVLSEPWGTSFAIAVALTAATGITLKLFGVARFPRLSNTLYIAMGLAGVLALPDLVGRIDRAALVLLALGGATYIAGAIVLMMKRPDPRPESFGYHEIWHSATVAAAACHFTMVAILVT